MKKIIFNEDNLTDKDIDEVVTRVKALIINSNNEIMLGYSNKTYQFPGGHLGDGEDLNDGLIREIREETGIDIKDYNLYPFQKITYLTKNYRNTGFNRKNNIYYFVVNTDEKENKDNISLDDGEIKGNYTVKTIPLNNLEKILIDSIPDNPINKIIVKEMLTVLKEYKKVYNRGVI